MLCDDSWCCTRDLDPLLLASSLQSPTVPSQADSAGAPVDSCPLVRRVAEDVLYCPRVPEATPEGGNALTVHLCRNSVAGPPSSAGLKYAAYYLSFRFVDDPSLGVTVIPIAVDAFARRLDHVTLPCPAFLPPNRALFYAFPLYLSGITFHVAYERPFGRIVHGFQDKRQLCLALGALLGNDSHVYGVTG